MQYEGILRPVRQVIMPSKLVNSHILRRDFVEINEINSFRLSGSKWTTDLLKMRFGGGLGSLLIQYEEVFPLGSQ